MRDKSENTCGLERSLEETEVQRGPCDPSSPPYSEAIGISESAWQFYGDIFGTLHKSQSFGYVSPMCRYVTIYGFNLVGPNTRCLNAKCRNPNGIWSVRLLEIARCPLNFNPFKTLYSGPLEFHLPPVFNKNG